MKKTRATFLQWINTGPILDQYWTSSDAVQQLSGMRKTEKPPAVLCLHRHVSLELKMRPEWPVFRLQLWECVQKYEHANYFAYSIKTKMRQIHEVLRKRNPL